MKLSALFGLAMLMSLRAISQCPTGEVEISIKIHTDDYGYEGYWQLLPAGNACGTGTLASGGNNAVGCNGGGAQNVTSGGYASNSVITAGPWCLTEGLNYDIMFVDDYGDGGFIFDVLINGFPVHTGLTGSGDAPGSRLTFLAQGPAANDAGCQVIRNNSYMLIGPNDIKAWVANKGTSTINSVDLYYSIDNGIPVLATITGLNIAAYDSLVITHPTQWNVAVNGPYLIKVWVANPNGVADGNALNNSAEKTVIVGPGIPNIIDGYIGMAPILSEIAGPADSIREPRDLDFHPVLTRYELWVVLKSTEAVGGHTVRLHDAGKPNQRFKWQKDGNAWHFMSLPTAIAFSENENFATSPGVFDANHNGGTPFTGPTLWSSDTNVYAMPSGGNGSHLDMLHQSPYSMGICSQEENKFWLFDNYDKEIVYYDFVNDHGPGASDHSDGIIRRYAGMGLAGDPNNEIPSHLVYQKETGMLFIVDTHNDRIVKMNTATGTFAGNLIPYEATAEYSNWTGASYSVIVDSGLTTPSGIDIIEDRMIVSDYATGDIIIYDISGSGATELGRIVTGTPGIMGIKIGPDGRIWYVNFLSNQVIRIDGLTLDVSENVEDNFTIYPNPATATLNIRMNGNSVGSFAHIYDMRGSLVRSMEIPANQLQSSIDISGIAPGIYSVRLSNSTTTLQKKFVKKY